ncbi:MAG: PHP domain-containing protein [Clostridia bacterium]|nr:PHP domain-containing protein [Clostridia bacterium]
MYKYELHTHSRGCSACAIAECTEIVDAAKEKGYAGIVFTNHFYRGNTSIDRNLPWKDFVEAYKQDYLIAKERGNKIGIDVIFGIEEGMGKGKEVLIYGIEADVIAGEPNFAAMDLKMLSDFVHKNGGVIYAAHPFRQRHYIANPRQEPDLNYLDGIEVYNHGNTKEDNQYAAEYAKQKGVSTISGGDVHSVGDLGTTGIATPIRIKSSKELVEVLKSGDYQLIIDGRKVMK